MSNMRLVRNAMFKNQASGIMHHIKDTRTRVLGFLWRRGKKKAIIEHVRIRNDAKLRVIEIADSFQLQLNRVQQANSKQKRRIKIRKSLY